MTFSRTGWRLALAWLLVALSQDAVAAGGDPASTAERPEAALIRMEAEFARAVATSDLGAFREFWAGDAAYLGASGRAVIGRDAVVEAWRPLLEATNLRLDWTPERAEVSGAGDLGYTWGRWVLVETGPDGDAQTASGSYATVWRRAQGGGWQVVLDIGNQEPRE